MLTNLFSLKNKVVFVTGASSGLGRNFALTLAKAGADVIIGARREDRLVIVAKEIESLGQKAFPVFVDMTKADSITKAVNLAVSEVGHIDILVNNAGNMVRNDLLACSEEEWDSIIDTHLKGTFLMSQAVAKHMIEKKIYGSIINISSIASSRARANSTSTVYSAAKAGIDQLTSGFALSLIRHNIRVNAIAPGFFITEINQDFLSTSAGKDMIANIPMKRVGQFNELDGALLLLASDASSYMTGSIINVDGGLVTNNLKV